MPLIVAQTMLQNSNPNLAVIVALLRYDTIQELPPWLKIKRATCTGVTVNVPWTKLKSAPVQIVSQLLQIINSAGCSGNQDPRWQVVHSVNACQFESPDQSPNEKIPLWRLVK